MQPMTLGSKKNLQVREKASVENLYKAIPQVHREGLNVLYNGVAQISKKRFGISNLLRTDFVDIFATARDLFSEALGHKIKIQLVSVDLDPGTKSPKLSTPSNIEGWWVTQILRQQIVDDYLEYNIQFEVPEDFGDIGAIVITNDHGSEFFLKKLILEGPGEISVVFNTLSWIYPQDKYDKSRVFFPSTKYITSETPEGLKGLREQELEQNRGDGKGKREAWDRTYDYDVYNDYGNPDKDIRFKRAVLGGSKDLPFPRRNRTGRPMSKADPKSESRLNFLLDVPYIPSDEFFVRTKHSTFIANFIKGRLHAFLTSKFSRLKRFDSRKDIERLYTKAHERPQTGMVPTTRHLNTKANQLSQTGVVSAAGRLHTEADEHLQTGTTGGLYTEANKPPIFPESRYAEYAASPFPVTPASTAVSWFGFFWLFDVLRRVVAYLTTFLGLVKGGDRSLVVYPRPQVIKHDTNAWERDEEFGRQTLAGLHPTVIQAVKEYPPKSSLDPSEYGEGTALTDEHILPYLHLEGRRLSVQEAISEKRLFTIDYRDALMSLVALANADEKAGFKCYSPRAIFFYTEDNEMVPIAIELSLPPSKKGDKVVNRVFTPADTNDHLWGLAKIHFSAIDSNYHQVYSHFTETHAAMEPFIISTRRQISALHPIFPLLVPHFKDTMNINAAARQILISAGGVIETSFSLGKDAMKAGAVAYGAFWRFDLINPARNLVHRGMAVPADESYPGGVKLLFEDYPFAKDSLDLWDALYKWVRSYINIVYKGSDDPAKADEAIKNDKEIQAWWDEIKNVGHADHKDASWWPKMDSVNSLADAIASMAYLAGPYHAAVNFGQWAYSGYPLNKPTGTRKFIPEKNSPEYQDLQKNPDKFLLETITNRPQATAVMSVLELLASHSLDEEYVGTKSLASDYDENPELAVAFKEFSIAIEGVELNIMKRNFDGHLKNRKGPANITYTLQYPRSEDPGPTGTGVPYSISI